MQNLRHEKPGSCVPIHTYVYNPYIYIHTCIHTYALHTYMHAYMYVYLVVHEGLRYRGPEAGMARLVRRFT